MLFLNLLCHGIIKDKMWNIIPNYMFYVIIFILWRLSKFNTVPFVICEMLISLSVWFSSGPRSQNVHLTLQKSHKTLDSAAELTAVTIRPTHERRVNESSVEMSDWSFKVNPHLWRDSVRPRSLEVYLKMSSEVHVWMFQTNDTSLLDAKHLEDKRLGGA